MGLVIRIHEITGDPKLAGVRAPRKVYIHVNNTNPMLDEDSEEYRLVRRSGWEIACDGMDFRL